jgi:hypothetical protein
MVETSWAASLPLISFSENYSYLGKSCAIGLLCWGEVGEGWEWPYLFCATLELEVG